MADPTVSPWVKRAQDGTLPAKSFDRYAPARRDVGRPCYCLALMRDHRVGARGCAFNVDWTSR